MTKVELIYEKSCPNVKAARQMLLLAFMKLGLTPHWQEWEVEDLATPEHLRIYGSPTILVDGEDAGGLFPNESTNCCRLYPDQDGVLRGTPSVEQIVSALLRARKQYCSVSS